HPFFLAVRGVSHFLVKEGERLSLSHNERAITQNWDYGHWILHDVDIPVVAHPFQDTPATETLALFVSPDVTALDTFVKRYPIRYLLLDPPTWRVQRWLQLFGRDTSQYFRPIRLPDGTGRSELLPPFFDLLLARFFFDAGKDRQANHPSHWRLVFISPF